MLNRNRVRTGQSNGIVRLIIAILILPWLVVAAVILGGLHKIRTSPVIARALVSINHYSCVSAADEMPPYPHRLTELSAITYNSMGGENLIQKMWLAPLTEVGIRTLYSKDEISRLYASQAFVYGTLISDRIVGFDELSQRLYSKDYCAISDNNKKAIAFLFYPLDQYIPRDMKVRMEIYRAKKILGSRYENLASSSKRI